MDTSTPFFIIATEAPGRGSQFARNAFLQSPSLAMKMVFIRERAVTFVSCPSRDIQGARPQVCKLDQLVQALRATVCSCH